MFRGSIVAIVTPFKNGKVDFDTLEKLVNFQIEKGSSGIVPCGTTGESPTLDIDEHIRVIEVTARTAKKRVPVIAGTGANSTEEAVHLSKEAEKAGADACLVVSPYYNKPTQKGLFLHFQAVAESVKIPLILYNIQSRTAVNIEPETIQKLAQIKNIVAVKEASGNLEQMARIISLCKDRITLLSGDDALTLPLLAIGGKGVISVVANIIPEDSAALVAAFEKGDIKTAQKLHYRMMPLVKMMFVETNPQPVKAAMSMLGLCSDDLRLPMCSVSDENRQKIRKALSDYGLTL